MWKGLVFLLLFLEVCLCRSLNATAPNNTRQVTQEELDFIAHMTKHSAIAQGKKIEQKFNGTEGSERFPNITLVQVPFSLAFSLTFRNSKPLALRNWRAMWLEMIEIKPSSSRFVGQPPPPMLLSMF